MAAKNYMIYYDHRVGSFVVTEPRPWAKANQQYFPEFGFTDADNDIPTPNQIKDRLKDRFGFRESDQNNDQITLLYNHDPNFSFP